MKALNLYMLCQTDDPEDFTAYENILSRRPEQKRVRENEQYSIQMLTEALQQEGLLLSAFDSFFFSYSIEHIGKEFDLLKISRDRSAVLNIELKSEPVEEWRIRKQLMQNRYYLRHISERIFSFTFEAEDGRIYVLDEAGRLVRGTVKELADVLRSFPDGIDTGIEDLFLAEDFLISPTGTPEKFLQGRYFLSPQQEYYKEQIVRKIEERTGPLFLGITGSSGTGKTLLLYDLAAGLAGTFRVRLVHGGQLGPGHRILEEAIDDLEICAGSEGIEAITEGSCDVLMVDETQHLSQQAFTAMTAFVRGGNRIGIFSFDEKKILSRMEQRRGISEQVTEMAESVYRLSGKIRTNKSLASFLRVFLESKSSTDHYFYRNIDVVYARDAGEGLRFRRYYEDKGYHFVDIAACVAEAAEQELEEAGGRESRYPGAVPENPQEMAEQETEQDYEDVVIRLDSHFYYDEEGTLRAEADPDPNILYDQLLFHGVTRTRNRLCVILEDNLPVFRYLNRKIRNRY